MTSVKLNADVVLNEIKNEAVKLGQSVSPLLVDSLYLVQDHEAVEVQVDPDKWQTKLDYIYGTGIFEGSGYTSGWSEMTLVDYYLDALERSGKTGTSLYEQLDNYRRLKALAARFDKL